MMNRFKRLPAVSIGVLAAVVVVASAALAADYRLPTDITAITVSSTATQMQGTAVAGQRALWLNPTDGTIFCGGPSVTSATGVQILDDQILMIDTTAGKAWYCITSSGTVSARVLPIAGG